MSQGQAPARKGGWARFSGMKWWEIALSILPMGLLFVGGLIGALIGIVGLFTNMAIARSKLGAGAKIPSMIGVIIACGVVQAVITAMIVGAVSR